MYRIKRGLFFKLIIASWTVFFYSALIQCCGFVIQSNMSKIIQDCFLLWGRSWQRICHGPRCRCDGGRAGSHVLLLSVEHTHRTQAGLTKYNGMFRARGAVIVIVLTLGLVGNAGAQRRWRSIVDDRHDRWQEKVLFLSCCRDLEALNRKNISSWVKLALWLRRMFFWRNIELF